MSEFSEKPHSSRAEKHCQDQGTSCLHFVTTNPDFSKPSPKKCPCFAEIDNFLVKNSTPSYSMDYCKQWTVTSPRAKISGAHTEPISAGPELRESTVSAAQLPSASIGFQTAYRTSRMSSKYIVPVPPAAGLFFVPKPMVIVLTLARSMPNAARSILHSVHLVICVAARSL